MNTMGKNYFDKIKSAIHLLRPAQWLKNLFVFLPVFMDGRLSDPLSLDLAIFAFISFCLTSSAIYCINDAVDASYDRLNPDKCHRPVASGRISKSEAYDVATLLIVIVVCTTLTSGSENLRMLLYVLSGYFVLNLGYTLYLKSLPVVDVVIIACCFLLRVKAGGVACEIPVTMWTMVLVFLLTLMLATGKRRYEAWMSESKGIKGRRNIGYYNVGFLNVMLGVLGIMNLLVYLCWTLSDLAEQHFGTKLLFLTSVFVGVGIGRYLWLIIKRNVGGNPTRILMHDHIIQLAVILWIITFFIVIYL